jgi:hypothetical protein
VDLNIDNKKFVDELLKKLLNDGYGTLSKNDFYDCIIYSS